MDARRCPVVIAAIVLVSATFVPVMCMPQDAGIQMAQPSRDLGGCADLKGLPKLAASHIVSCDQGDSIEVIMPQKPDAEGNPRDKSVRGHYDFREYQLPSVYQGDQAFLSLMQWLALAGFKVKYSSSPSTITARKEDTWVLVTVSGEYYDVKSVRVEQSPWAPAKDAEGISQEMRTNQRAEIYGIEFSRDSQNVVEEHSKILGEVLAYLKANPGLTVEVESHTMTNDVDAESDLAITRKRAQAVATWLEAHGIAAGRLRAQGLGRSKPLMPDNDTLMEIQRNDRVELAKIAP